MLPLLPMFKEGVGGWLSVVSEKNMDDFVYQKDNPFYQPNHQQPIYEFANVPERIHHLGMDIKLHIAQPGNREYRHGPRVKVFRHDPYEEDAFVIRLSQKEQEIEVIEGTFSGLMNRSQYKKTLEFVRKYRIPLLNLWYRPGADIMELQDEIALIDQGRDVPFHGRR